MAQNNSKGKNNFRKGSKSSNRSDYKTGSNNTNRHTKRNSDADGVHSRNDASSNSATPRVNHREWHMRDPYIVKDVASIPFTYGLGYTMPTISGLRIAGDSSDTGIRPTDRIGIPGVMVPMFHPLPGIALDKTAPVNIFANRLYIYIRKNQSVYANYEASDVMMYLLSMDSIFTWWAVSIRLYTIMQTYTNYNYYTPRGIFAGMHFDYDDFAGRVAEFRAAINMYSKRMSTLVIPRDFNYITRHTYLFGNVFKDDNLVKPQYILPMPTCLYKFDAWSSETGGKLTPYYLEALKTSGTNTISMDNWLAIGEDMMDRILYNQDCLAMSGDILKAFGEATITRVGMIEDNMKFEAMYDEDFLMELQNAYVGRRWPAEMNLMQDEIYQDGIHGTIICNPTIPGTYYPDAVEVRAQVNVNKDHPDPADVLMATRFIALTKDRKESASWWEIDSAGSEILAMIRIVNTAEGSNGQSYFYTSTLPVTYTYTTDGSANSIATAKSELLNHAAKMNLAAQFNHAPRCTAATVPTNGESSIVWLVNNGNWFNVTDIDRSTLRRIHTADLMSLFGSSAMGAYDGN